MSMKTKILTMNVAKLILVLFFSGTSARADDPHCFAYSGPYDPETLPFSELDPDWVEVQRHFLFEADLRGLEQPRENWTEKVEKRDALLKDIESREGISEAWDEAFLDAASWHYPKGGDLEAARLYFERKREWMVRMFNEPKWFHDPVHLDAVADFLVEIREWSLPAWVITYTDHPGQDILVRAGVESPEELPGEAQRAAYRKAVEKNDRMIALSRLRYVLLHGSGVCLHLGWWHCKQALLAAEKAGDASAVQRLSAIKKKMFASAEHPEIFTSSDWADMPDL